jgi:hypothetical protein
MKTAIALAELLAFGLLLVVLARLGLPAERVVLYAWNPLLLLEVWSSGHLDGLVLPAILGALLAAIAGRPVLVGVLLGAGTLVKLYPAVLLPVLGLAAIERRTPATTRRAAPLTAFLAVVVIGYAPLARLGPDLLGSLPRYLREEHFNPGLVRTLADHPAVTLLALVAWITWATAWRRDTPLGARALRLAGGVTVLHPNLVPWYALWLVPWLALAPSITWVAFTGSIALAYTFFLDIPWAIPPWARVVQFAPFLIAGAAAIRHLCPGWHPGTGHEDFTTR